MFFLASNLNFIFLFISLIYIFDCNGVETAAEDAEVIAVIAAAAVIEGEGEGGGEGRGGEESGKAANSDGDSDSGDIAKK
jgi:hypothetical protein